MKKGWRVLALALTVAQMTPVSAYAAQGNNVETVFYNGREIDRANLSKDTISWLEWYNSLPKKEQNAVNYEPDGVQKKSDAFTQVEEALYASDTDTWQEWFASLSQNVQNTVNYNPDEPMHGETVDAVSKSKSKKDIVWYDGIDLKKDGLSVGSCEWLEWYNGLSKAEKEMVSYEPLEVSIALKQTQKSSKMEDKLQSETGMVDCLQSEGKLLPTSGYEPSYNPKYWNKTPNINRANCYAYGMQVLLKENGKLQPGDASGKRFTSLTKKAIFKAAKADGPYLGYGRSIRTAEKNEKPKKNEYKVALVIAPNKDYHWYIQNKNGYWSHKPGLTKAVNEDASGKKIVDPRICDRNYGSLNYSKWAGYYIIKYKTK